MLTHAQRDRERKEGRKAEAMLAWRGGLGSLSLTCNPREELGRAEGARLAKLLRVVRRAVWQAVALIMRRLAAAKDHAALDAAEA